MDLNDLRSIVTLVSMLTFVGIIVWAFSRRNRKGFDEAAMLPFIDEPIAADDKKGDGK